MSRNLLPSNETPFGVDDPFDAYIDMDFLRNDTIEEEVDIGNMSNSDLFHYYFEGELAKDQVNLDTTTTDYVAMQNVDDYSLATGPITVPEKSNPNQGNVIEDAPLLSQPTTTTVSTAVGPSLAILNAQLAELLAKLPSIKQEAIIENKVSSLPDSTSSASSPLTTPSRSNNNSNNSDSANNDGQKQTDDNNQIDLKKLSSKERRQLRNKISARNFRVRRKGLHLLYFIFDNLLNKWVNNI